MSCKSELVSELLHKLYEFESNMEEWHDESLTLAEEYSQQLREELEQWFED